MLTKYRKNRILSGQTMTEYVIIVALIAIFCIGIFTLFGHQIQNTTASIINKLSGKESIHENVEQEDIFNELEARDKEKQMSDF